MSRRRALWDKRWPVYEQLTAQVEVKVPFQDADPTGVAWHGNYFRYYDAARVTLLDKLQFGYRQMARLGQIWPIVDTRVRYLRSAPFDSTLKVHAQLVEWEFRLRIYYLVTTPDGDLVNEAYTVQVPVDAQSEQLIIGSPDMLMRRIESLIAG